MGSCHRAASHRTALQTRPSKKPPAELMSEEPKIHIGKWTPKKQLTRNRMLISLGHRSYQTATSPIKKRRTGIAMSDTTNAYIPAAALTGSMRDFRVPGGADLLGRTEGFFKWQNLRRQNGLWPFSRATEDGPNTVCWHRTIV